jgi:hypothetical protein
MVFINLNITDKDVSLLINNTNSVINISEISICNINATDTISFSIYKKIGTKSYYILKSIPLKIQQTFLINDLILNVKEDLHILIENGTVDLNITY